MQHFRNGSRIVWFLVGCVALVVLFGPIVTRYLEQQDELQREAAKVEQKRQAIAELKDTDRRLQDPAFIKRTARERLQMVEPGDRPLIVLNDTGSETVDESIVGAPMAESTFPTPTGTETSGSAKGKTGHGAKKAKPTSTAKPAKKTSKPQASKTKPASPARTSKPAKSQKPKSSSTKPKSTKAAKPGTTAKKTTSGR